VSQGSTSSPVLQGGRGFSFGPTPRPKGSDRQTVTTAVGACHPHPSVGRPSGVDDFEVAEATYRAAVARWPAARVTLRQGIRVVHDTR
jgi:hypothetical protein